MEPLIAHAGGSAYEHFLQLARERDRRLLELETPFLVNETDHRVPMLCDELQHVIRQRLSVYGRNVLCLDQPGKVFLPFESVLVDFH